MSFRVVAEVLDRSQAAGTDRLVLVAIAECASHDGVAWLRIGESPSDEKSICRSANCSKREALRAVQALREDLRELETRKVRRGRSFVTVYRIVVGNVGEQPVDYNRLPFGPFDPFLHGDDLARWRRGEDVSAHGDSSPETDHVHGDDSAPSTGPVTVPDAAVHGDISDQFTVTPSRAREERPIREPSDGSTRAGAREPSAREDREEAETRQSGVRARLRQRASLIRLERRRAVCPDCGVGGGRHTVDCGSARETIRQAYERFVDETVADPDYPLEEITAVIASWDDIDDVDRQELVDRAEHARSGESAGKAAA